MSVDLKIDTTSTQTQKNRHKMQKIDTKNIVLSARVVRTWINGLVKWRVYYNQELIATYENEDSANKYAEYLNDNF